MERLWATWRAPYIRTVAQEGGGCIFCRLPADRNDEGNLILYRGRSAFIILNRFPYNPGHVMAAPYRHVPSLGGLTKEEVLEIWRLTKLSLRAIGEAMKPDGFNVGVNIGRTAGAGVEGHVHVHIVPRWDGDTNFMPVLGGTKVISESMEKVYRELRERIDGLSTENV